jgi:hypothetical protein
MSALGIEDKEATFTRYSFAAVVWVILRLQAPLFAVAESSDINAVDAILAFTVPVFLLWGEASGPDVLDQVVCKVRISVHQAKKDLEGMATHQGQACGCSMDQLSKPLLQLGGRKGLRNGVLAQ